MLEYTKANGKGFLIYTLSLKEIKNPFRVPSEPFKNKRGMKSVANKLKGDM